MQKNSYATLILVSSIVASNFGFGQEYQVGHIQKLSGFHWPTGKKMAISLTFDDARYSQVDNGLPILDRYGVTGTFYVSPENLAERIEGWKNGVKKGHEIGNHSLYHACSKNFEWSREHSLEETTLKQMREQLDSSNAFIQKILGIKVVSFAYPCGQKYVGNGVKTKSYVPLIARQFETGRGWRDEDSNDPVYCNFYQLNGIEMDGKSFDEIKILIDNSKAKGNWLLLAGHDIGSGGDQTTLINTLEAICEYAADPAHEIWLDNVHNIASYIKKQRKIH
jgi:peptidoglycan/xylan/chitin deacetylase (PgdA/CDA1 family)